MTKVSDFFDEYMHTTYLHADSVANKDIIEITGKAKYVSAELSNYGKPFFVIPVSTAKGHKSWIPNKTTLSNLAEAFGDDMDFWVGKKVKLSVVQQEVSGEQRKVIYGEPVIAEDASKSDSIAEFT